MTKKPKTSRRPQSNTRLITIFVLTVFLAGEIVLSGIWVSRSAEQSISDYDSAGSSQTALPLTAEECISAQPLSWLTGQVLMIGLRAGDMADSVQLFTQFNIGGAVLMTAPANPGGGEIIDFKRAAASRSVPVLIATDEEGGSVQRFSDLGVLPSPQVMAASRTPEQAQQAVYSHGLNVKAAGVDMVLGPLADVAPSTGTSPLGDRIFSSDPADVKAYDLSYISGWQRAGLLPTLKHFPGLGSASANTDYQPASAPPLSQLKQRDFIPYESTAGTGTAVMVGNQNVPGWFSGPASLNPLVDQYLRGPLGYKNNLVVTDSLSVPGVTSGVSEVQAVVGAITAGNDIAMLVEPGSSPTPTAEVISQAEQAIEDAVSSGKLPKQQLIHSVLRKLAAEHIPACSARTSANS